MLCKNYNSQQGFISLTNHLQITKGLNEDFSLFYIILKVKTFKLQGSKHSKHTV